MKIVVTSGLVNVLAGDDVDGMKKFLVNVNMDNLLFDLNGVTRTLYNLVISSNAVNILNYLLETKEGRKRLVKDWGVGDAIFDLYNNSPSNTKVNNVTNIINIIISNGYKFDNQIIQTILLSDNLHLLQILINNGLELNKIDDITILDTFPIYYLDILKDNGFDFNNIRNIPYNITLLKYILDNGFSPNNIKRIPETSDYIEILNLLFQYGFDINNVTRIPYNPKILKYAIDLGLDINKIKYDNIPDDLELISVMISSGFDLKNFNNLEFPRYPNVIKLLLEAGVIPLLSPQILYKNTALREQLNIPIYKSQRPIIEMSFVENNCKDGLYLPVYRIDSLYYDKKEKVDKYCGTFYFYEPESKYYLNIGKTFISANKVDAMIKLYFMFVNKYQQDTTIFYDIISGNYEAVVKNDFESLILRMLMTYKNLYLDYNKNINQDVFNIKDMAFFNNLLLDEEMAENIVSNIKNNFYNSLYYDSYGDTILHEMYNYDMLDQSLCTIGKDLGFDTLIFQKEPGGYRANTEILDVRTKSESYNSFCIQENISLNNNNRHLYGKYPTIWFVRDGFVHLGNNPYIEPTKLNQIIPMNSIEILSDYLTKLLFYPTMFDLIDTVENAQMKELLTDYKYLFEHKLNEPSYLHKNINLEIITTKGYLPLLVYHYTIMKNRDSLIETIMDKSISKYATTEVHEWILNNL